MKLSCNTMAQGWIQQRVQEKGYKLTSTRKRLFSYIESVDGIVSVGNILEALPMLDKVSVYRTIDLLVTLDIIHAATQIDGQQYYEVHQEEQHHHHIVCTECLTSECVPCDVPMKKIPRFTHVHHSLTMTGVCMSCAT